MCFHASVFASEVLCFHCVHLCVGVFLQFRHRHSFGLKVELIRVCMVTIQNIWGLIMPKFHTSPRIITILVFFIWLRLKHLRWVPKCVYAEKKQNQNPDCKMMFLQKCIILISLACLFKLLVQQNTGNLKLILLCLCSRWKW